MAQIEDRGHWRAPFALDDSGLLDLKKQPCTHEQTEPAKGLSA